MALSPRTEKKFCNLQEEGKSLAKQGLIYDALQVFLEAKNICATQKVLQRIAKLEGVVKDYEENDEPDNNGIEVCKGFSLYSKVYQNLYEYQRVGVSWMYKLFQKKKGGVLGDDMGLGKTFQVIAFLSGMIDNGLAKNVLIVMPVSLLPNWSREFEKWCPSIDVHDYHALTKKQRERNLNRVQRRGGVLLTSYGMIVSSYESITSHEGRYFVWDYVILDEGHKIKNPTKTTKAVHEIAARNRLVLTGTPLQNNLTELWALYDFTHQGTLLGSKKTFKMQYETPITRGREKDAIASERELGKEMAGNLKRLIEPYFLRRTKEVLDNQAAGDDLTSGLQNLKLQALPQKNDFIVWLYLSDAQYEIYKDFLESDAVKQLLLISKRSPLVELTTLKKICDHPRLLSQRACAHLGLNKEHITDEDLDEIERDERYDASSIENVPDEILINESGKLKFTITLLEKLKAMGHRTLVFSLSRKILDMIQRILLNRGIKVLRIDGTITKMGDRFNLIEKFQGDSSYSVFLLTTQVGGVGITLTQADRVIIYDPSWNPATDAQAVDRIYRIGQEKNIVVYRLITCASVEEKIYRRQIFKDSINRQTTGNSKDPHRYFSKQELRDLFVLDDRFNSNTQIQLQEMHAAQRKTDTQLDEHIAFLHSLDIFGISDHNLMFSKEVNEDQQTPEMEDYIKKRVQAAEQIVQSECDILEGMKQTETYFKPFTLPIQSKKKSANDKYQPPKFPEVVDFTKSTDSSFISKDSNQHSFEIPSDSSSHVPSSSFKGNTKITSPNAAANSRKILSSEESGLNDKLEDYPDFTSSNDSSIVSIYYSPRKSEQLDEQPSCSPGMLNSCDSSLQSQVQQMPGDVGSDNNSFAQHEQSPKHLSLPERLNCESELEQIQRVSGTADGNLSDLSILEISTDSVSEIASLKDDLMEKSLVQTSPSQSLSRNEPTSPNYFETSHKTENLTEDANSDFTKKILFSDSFDFEPGRRSSRRISCAVNRSTVLISDSENSDTSAPSSDASENAVLESEEEYVENSEDESPNVHDPRPLETPGRENDCTPTAQNYGSPSKRITPLKISSFGSESPLKTPFQKALSMSKEFYSSPRLNDSNASMSSNDSFATRRKRARQILPTDSEDED